MIVGDGGTEQHFDAATFGAAWQPGSRRIATMTADLGSGRSLTLTPTESWLRASSEDAQLMAATAIYGMWKNYRNQAPVEVVLLDADGEPYVAIRDQGEAGPQLTVVDQASGRES